MTSRVTFQMKIRDAVICEYITIHNNLYWYNLDYYHPKMQFEDGEPYVKCLISFVMRFKT